jgi:nucleoside-diphosphate-sugar epimerase
MTVLVTGGAGFVGLNLCERLLVQGETVVSFSKGPMPEQARREFAQLSGTLRVVEGDVLSREAVNQVFGETRPQRVIHAAAMTPGESAESTAFRQVVETNIVGTVNVLDAAREHGAGRVLHLSSGSVYGKNAFAAEELDEEHPVPLPETLYAISKYAGERIALRYRRNWGMDLVAARLGAVFGPWEYESGVRDTLSAPLLVCALALRGGEAVLSGEGRRDWLYARDVAEALVGLLAASAPAHELYNVASGKVWDMTSWCELLKGRHPGFTWRIAAQGEDANVDLYGSTLRAPMSARRLAEETGFAARFGLQEAFADYMEWLESHDNSLLPSGTGQAPPP